MSPRQCPPALTARMGGVAGSAGDSRMWGMLRHSALGEVLQEKPTWSPLGDLLRTSDFQTKICFIKLTASGTAQGCPGREGRGGRNCSVGHPRGWQDEERKHHGECSREANT